MTALTIVRGGFTLSNVENLGSLAGLTALDEITGTMTLSSNQQLTDLHGLDSLQALGGNLQVTSNPALPTCEAHWLRDTVTAGDFDGTVTITGNVADACGS